MILLYIIFFAFLIFIIKYSISFLYRILKGIPVAAFSIYNKQDTIVHVFTKTSKWKDKFKSISFINISKFLNNHFEKRHTIFDINILNNIDIVFYDDPNSKIESYHKEIYDIETLKWINVIFINCSTLIDYNDLQFTEIFLHEYFHFWMKKYKNTFDDNHQSSLWKIQNIFNNHFNKGMH